MLFFGMSSCSSDDAKVMQSDEKTNFNELNNSLQSYTKEFEASHGKIIETRFLGLKRFWDSVKADAYVTTTTDNKGEKSTSTGLSISTSRKNWKDSGNKMLEYDDLTEDSKNSVDKMLDELKAQLDEDGEDIGALHNAVILKMITDDSFNNTENVDDVQAFLQKMTSDYNVDVSAADPVYVYNKMTHFLSDIYNENDDVMCANILAEYPDVEEELNVIKACFSELYNYAETDDVDGLTNGYNKIVQNSNISKESKKTIGDALSIAASSYRLWNMVDSLEKKK